MNRLVVLAVEYAEWGAAQGLEKGLAEGMCGKKVVEASKLYFEAKWSVTSKTIVYSLEGRDESTLKPFEKAVVNTIASIGAQYLTKWALLALVPNPGGVAVLAVAAFTIALVSYKEEGICSGGSSCVEKLILYLGQQRRCR